MQILTKRLLVYMLSELPGHVGFGAPSLIPLTLKVAPSLTPLTLMVAPSLAPLTLKVTPSLAPLTLKGTYLIMQLEKSKV